MKIDQAFLLPILCFGMFSVLPFVSNIQKRSSKMKEFSFSGSKECFTFNYSLKICNKITCDCCLYTINARIKRYKLCELYKNVCDAKIGS